MSAASGDSSSHLFTNSIRVSSTARVSLCWSKESLAWTLWSTAGGSARITKQMDSRTDLRSVAEHLVLRELSGGIQHPLLELFGQPA